MVIETMETDTETVIPLRHSSLPGLVRLPQRYRTATKDSNDNRKGSISNGVVPNGMADRLEDLGQALLWIKQELIMMRQHDILLKRQFCDIHDTITSLNRRCKHSTVNSSSTSLHSHASSIDITLENYGFRNASSVTILNEDESEEDDILGDLFRPRTSSMKTTRDLAALARRRGSKELI